MVQASTLPGALGCKKAQGILLGLWPSPGFVSIGPELLSHGQVKSSEGCHLILLR